MQDPGQGTWAASRDGTWADCLPIFRSPNVTEGLVGAWPCCVLRADDAHLGGFNNMNNTTLGRVELGQRTVQPTKAHGISRRTVAKGMAWTTPVVLSTVTAPVFAASTTPCTTPTPGVLVTTDNLVSHVMFGDIKGTVTYTQNGYDDDTPVDTGRMNTTAFTRGVPNYDYIMLRHDPLMDKGWWVALTIKFDAPVSKLSLKLTDIDKKTGAWIDHVIVTPAGFTSTFAVPPTVDQEEIPTPFLTGVGSAANPFQARGEWSLTLDRNNGDVALTWPGQVTEVTVRFLAFDTIGASRSGQHIGVGDFSLGC